MARIDYFFSPLSPYTYLAGTRAEEIAARHGATIAYKPVDVVQMFARTGGTPPKDRHISRQEYRAQDLARSARMADMPLHVKPAHWPTNSAPASYAIIAAQGAGGGDPGGLAAALARACWAEQKDIAQEDVIRDCLSANGFDPDLVNSGLLSGAETYASNLEEAVRRGVFGVPFWITQDDQRFWGHDRLNHLDAHLAATA